MTVFPAGLVVAGRSCLVVGAGPVGSRRASDLVEAGAAVTVIAPDASEQVLKMARDDLLVHFARPYRRGEVVGHWLVFAATGIRDVDRAVCLDAERARVWANGYDNPSDSTFVLPAILRAGPICVTVSTQGTSPAFAAWLRDRLDGAVGPDLVSVAALVAEARAALKAAGVPTGVADWKGLLDGGLVEAVAAGRDAEARALVDAWLAATLEANATG